MMALTSLIGCAALLGLLLNTPGIHAQDAKDPRIQHIRKVYSDTEGGLKKCTTVKREIEGQSTEGGELTAYLRGAEVVKLNAVYYGESGKATEAYYLEEGRVVFILRTDMHYDKPLSGVVKSKTEERFYFAGDELITWLDETKKSVPVTSAVAGEKAKEMLDRAKLLLELARSPGEKR